VVLFGPLADIARELLIRNFALRFASPSSSSDDATVNNSNQGIVRLSTICQVMAKNQHCLLDITPGSVEKLQYAQYAPIVILIDVDSRSRLRDLRTKSGIASANNVSTKKLIEQSHRIKKHYSHLLTGMLLIIRLATKGDCYYLATLDASKEDEWFDALRELIVHLQDRRVWMAESRPTDIAVDDFLFPMANSRFNNYDSDGESIKGVWLLQCRGQIQVRTPDEMICANRLFDYIEKLYHLFRTIQLVIIRHHQR
jgi:tight junction protein 1